MLASAFLPFFSLENRSFPPSHPPSLLPSLGASHPPPPLRSFACLAVPPPPQCAPDLHIPFPHPPPFPHSLAVSPSQPTSCPRAPLYPRHSVCFPPLHPPPFHPPPWFLLISHLSSLISHLASLQRSRLLQLSSSSPSFSCRYLPSHLIPPPPTSSHLLPPLPLPHCTTIPPPPFPTHFPSPTSPLLPQTASSHPYFPFPSPVPSPHSLLPSPLPVPLPISFPPTPLPTGALPTPGVQAAAAAVSGDGVCHVPAAHRAASTAQ
ncbi:unnamed protein product, partial [Closterium sp. NIES-53]